MSEGIAADLEALLASALRPVDPPETLVGRIEGTLTGVAEAAAADLDKWAEELTDSELQALRDPRNWVRPVASVAAGGIAAGALVVLGVRRNRSPTGMRKAVEGAAEDIRRALEKLER